jgi:flagellar hook-associated protein 2
MGISLNPSTILNGSGIDVSSIVQQIIGNKSGELNTWETESTNLATQDGVLEGIENDLVALQTSVQALADPAGALTAVAATSSNTAVLTASTTGTNATVTSGTYDVVVQSIASAGSVFSAPVSGGASASFLTNGATSGSLTLQIGAGSSATTQTIQIAQGTNDTLTSLASSINTASTAGNWGVTASVVTDATGSWLDVQSQNTGAAGALSITGNSNTSLSFNSAGGANASITVDGVPYTSASNTFSPPSIPGVTLSLQNASASPVQVTVGPDSDQIDNAIGNFVTAYNTLVTTINGQYVVDPTGATPAPPLESDTSLRTLQSSILADVAYALPNAIGGTTVNSGLINLASLGINLNNDGTLTVGNNAAGQSFDQVVSANPSAVLNFFQNSSNTGFANAFAADLTNLTDATSGPLNVDVTQNTSQEQTLSTDISNFETQLTNEQQQLTSQFDAVNASLQSYPLLLQEVTETLGSLGAGSDSSSSSTTSPILTAGL